MSDFNLVAFLEQMLRIPSVSGQEGQVARFLVDQMQALGFHSYIDDAGNAVGEAGAGPEIVLLGHIDTVPGVVPVRIDDGKLYGRGSVDAKGPFATFVAAAARLIAQGKLRARLVLIGAVEEEAASSKGAHYVVDRYAPIACVIGEPSGWDRLTLGYKGRLLVEGHWEQPMAHSAGRDVAVAERAVGFWYALAAYCAEYNEGKTQLFDQLLPSLRAITSGTDGLTDWAKLTIGIRLPPDVEEMLLRTFWFVAAAITLVASGGFALAEGPGDPAAVKSEDGKYLDKEGNPTFKVAPDGTVDWYTYSGYRRYHSECHVCHGPDGMGSTYAPALQDSLKTMSYGDFLGVVASGRKNISTSQENVMPAFGDNPNVACYMDDLYIYLRARAHDAVGRVRPAKREDKPDAYTEAEKACMGTK